jgi:hypothetical protein
VIEPDPETKVIEQFVGYFDHEDTTPEVLATRLQDPNEYWGWPNGIAVHTQVIKQPDVVQLFVNQPERFDRDVIEANFDYYLRAPSTAHRCPGRCTRWLRHGSAGSRGLRAVHAGRTVDLLADSQPDARAGPSSAGSTPPPAVPPGRWRSSASVASTSATTTSRSTRGCPRVGTGWPSALPVGVRTAGIVHRNAGLAAVVDRADALPVEVLVVSGLLGVAGLDEPMPDHRLELAVTLPPLGGLATFWKRVLTDHLGDRLAGRPVVDLLPGEHARAIAPTVRERPGWTEVAFVGPDGRAANAARTKVAKGRLVAGLLARSGLDAAAMTAPALAARVELGEGWQLTAEGDARLVAVYAG